MAEYILTFFAGFVIGVGVLCVIAWKYAKKK